MRYIVYKYKPDTMKPLFCIFCLLLLFGCNTEEETYLPAASGSYTPGGQTKVISYLALGDSYTKGESVCSSCNYPTLLSVALNSAADNNVDLKMVAQTGWTTNDLLYALPQSNIGMHYNLVTLLIGVNNQYGQENFSVYETEFNQLLDKAIFYANGNTEHVVVISIPDYAYTPYGASLSDNQRQGISTDIDTYNAYAAQQSAVRNVTFLNITDITRNGLNQPELVASDGLHPSSVAYQKFVERLLPVVRGKLNF